MTTFDERERAFENMFAHDEELRFLTLVRRNQLLARWAAEMIGLRGTEYQTYIQSFVVAAVQGKSDEFLFQRTRADLVACGIDTSDDGIRSAMNAAADDAVLEVRTQRRHEALTSFNAR